MVVQALFRNAVNGIYYEAAIPSTPGSKEFLLPFDSTTFAGNGQQLVTGIAIANLDNSAANIVCTAYILQAQSYRELWSCLHWLLWATGLPISFRF